MAYKNIEDARAASKKYYEANKEEVLKKNREYHKKWYQENKEKKDAKNKEWHKNNRKRSVEIVQAYNARNKEKVAKYNSEYGKSLAGFWRRYKYRAKKAGLEITITLKDFKKITNQPCVYCDEEERQRGIDRVDNNKGYVIDNCASCCGKCNMMKMKQTKEEFLEHIEKIYKHNS